MLSVLLLEFGSELSVGGGGGAESSKREHGMVGDGGGGFEEFGVGMRRFGFVFGHERVLCVVCVVGVG